MQSSKQYWAGRETEEICNYNLSFPNRGPVFSVCSSSLFIICVLVSCCNTKKQSLIEFRHMKEPRDLQKALRWNLHWPGAKKGERKNYCDLRREKSHAGNKPKRERESGREGEGGQGGLGAERNGGRERTREAEGRKGSILWIDKRGQYQRQVGNFIIIVVF